MQQLYTDIPIDRAEDDLLGRTDFAKSLARRLHMWESPQTLTMAIAGDWGSGKTSVVNLALNELHKLNEGSTSVCMFNPWQWSGQDQLAEVLFRELEYHLRIKNESKHPHRKRWVQRVRTKRRPDRVTANMLRLYRAHLGLGVETVSAFARILVAALSALTIIGISWLPDVLGIGSPSTTIIIIGAAGVVAAIAAIGDKVLKVLTDVYDARAAMWKQPHDIKEDLQKRLRNNANKIIVVIDDIDRLSKAEIRQLFQFLKANLDLPYIIYLLLYQQNIVELALQEDGSNQGDHGRRYLEKFVQLTFRVPRASPSRISKVLIDQMASILPLTSALGWHDERWRSLFLNGIVPFFSNLRDVNRYINSLSFHIPQYSSSEGVYEANLLDVTALEVLRLFEPSVYRGLSRSERILVGTRSMLGTNAKEKVQEIVDLSSPEHRGAVLAILCDLFPSVAGGFQKMASGDASTAGTLRDRRVCHPYLFGMYFDMILSDVVVNRSDVDRIIASTRDKSTFVDVAREMRDSGNFDVVTDVLESYAHLIPQENAEEFIKGWAIIAHESDDMFAAFNAFETLTLELLKRIPDISTRSQVVLDAFSGVNALAVLSSSV